MNVLKKMALNITMSMCKTASVDGSLLAGKVKATNYDVHASHQEEH